MKNFIFVIWLTNFCLFFFALAAYGYDPNAAHPAINKASLQLSSADNFLRTILHWPAGVSTEVEGMSVKQWMEEGGKQEDDGTRGLRHFHDPSKAWNSAGLPLMPSNLVWSQQAAQEGETTFSWQTARESYFVALETGNTDDFAVSFRAIGQIIHLLSDMAVPAHVRNDKHPDEVWRITIGPGDPYENWTKANVRTGKINFTDMAVPVPHSIFQRAIPNPLAPAAISALWDQDVYRVDTPDPAVTRGALHAGLAEYTNANFFSKDTVFLSYPHPAREDTDVSAIDWRHPEAVDAEDGSFDQRLFIRGDAGGPAPIRLASIGYWSYDCLQAGYSQFGDTTVLDDKVHEDYASLLIPRAVGYSKALLDYFFSGSLEIAAPEGFVYAITDGSVTPFEFNPIDPQRGVTWWQQFTELKAAVRLTTPEDKPHPFSST